MAATGDIQVVGLDGKGRRVTRGDALNPGDRVITGGNGLVQIRMADGSYLSVRSNTEMALDRFEVDSANNHRGSSFLISLVKGGLRAITGLIGRSNPDAYKVRTPTATIGVRGTDHEPMYIPDASPTFSALGAPGVYDKVNDGESYIQSAAGIVALKVGQIGHVGKPQEMPVLLKTVPSFYKVDVKIDARPKEDIGVIKSLPTAAKPLMLRPTIGSRIATPTSKLGTTATTGVIGGTTTIDPKLTTTTTLSTSTLSTATKDTTSTTLTSPTLSTSTLSTTTLTSPTLSTTTTTLDPALSTSTLSTTTLTSPTLSTTTTSPTLSTSTLSTTTLTSPTLSTSTLSTTTTTSPTLSTTTTTSPTLLNSTTLTSPTLSTTTLK